MKTSIKQLLTEAKVLKETGNMSDEQKAIEFAKAMDKVSSDIKVFCDNISKNMKAMKSPGHFLFTERNFKIVMDRTKELIDNYTKFYNEMSKGN